MTINAFLLAVKVVRDMPEDMSNLDKIKRLDALDKAALNAADEIEELRDWVRDEAEHARGCSGEFGLPCKCGLDRIREIVK